jgi:hypothetical protein
VLGELVRPDRRERDAVLVVLDFLGDADLHRPGFLSLETATLSRRSRVSL